MYLWLLGVLFKLFIILSFFPLLDILFKSNLFISSLILATGIPILSFRNRNLLSFCSNALSRSDIVSPILFIACVKTFFWIKVFWPIWDIVENDSLLYLSIVCEISFCILASFFITSIISINWLDEKTCSIRILPWLALFSFRLPPFIFF